MKYIILGLFAICIVWKQAFAQQLPSEWLLIDEIEIYAKSFKVNSNPGILGFDLKDYVLEGLQNGDRRVEYHVIKSSKLTNRIVEEIWSIKERSDCSHRSSSPFPFVLMTMKSDGVQIGYFWIELLSDDHHVIIDDCVSHVRKGDLRTLLKQIELKEIRKPIRKWIRKAQN